MLMRQNHKNLFLNTSTWYFSNYLQFTKVGTRKGMDVEHLTLYSTYIWLCTNLWTYLFMHLCERKKSFIKIPTVILYLMLWTLGFCRFGILTGLGGWVWNLASFWCKMGEIWYVSDPLNRYTNIGKSEIFHA